MRTVFAFIFIAAISTHAQAQTTALDVCNTLARSGLVDTHSSVQREAIANQEFELFCSQKGSLKSSFAQKSKSFSASFARVAQKYSGSAGLSSASGMSEQQFEAVCERGSSEFAKDYSSQIQTSVGSVLAANVAKCVQGAVGGNTDIVYGNIQISYGGDTLTANIHREAPNTSDPLTFTGITPSSEVGDCRANSKPAAGAVLLNNLSIECDLRQNDGAYPELIRGTMSFRTAKQAGKSVEFDVRRPGRYNEQDVQNAIERALAGSIVAFNAPACPQGWQPFPAAAGRMIVGAGSGNSDGLGKALSARKAGDTGGLEQVQLSVDELPGHRHGVYRHSGEKLASGGVNGSNSDDSGTRVREWETGAAGKDRPHENMPPYLALTYCIRG